MPPLSGTPETPASNAIRAVAARLHLFARRWAVNLSPNPEDAVIFDLITKALRLPSTPARLSNTPLAATAGDAASARLVRSGSERIVNDFAVPVTLNDCVVVLHRFARRYTNGRGTTSAAVVNAAARELQQLGVDLSETMELDGTIWAADGADGAFDELSAEERAEALAALSATPTVPLPDDPDGGEPGEGEPGDGSAS